MTLLQKTGTNLSLSKEAKAEFEKRAAEINQAYTEIKKERGIK